MYTLTQLKTMEIEEIVLKLDESTNPYDQLVIREYLELMVLKDYNFIRGIFRDHFLEMAKKVYSGNEFDEIKTELIEQTRLLKYKKNGIDFCNSQSVDYIRYYKAKANFVKQLDVLSKIFPKLSQ